MFYFISVAILRIILKIFFRLRIIGLKNLPSKGPYIAACNHVSYLDPVIFGTSIPRRTRFLAREDLFQKKGFLGWWVKNMGCIPVKRNKSDTRAIKEALKTLAKGGIVALFPEGTRSIDGSLKKGQAGIGFLASKANVAVVPTYIKGSKEALRKHSKLIKFKPIWIYFGERIEPASFKKITDSKELYRKITQEVMNAIAQLKEKHGE